MHLSIEDPGRVVPATTSATESPLPTIEDLLAIVLGGPPPPPDPAWCARELVRLHGPLRRLSTRTIHELAGVAGLGPARALRLAAVFALSRRLMEARLEPGATFGSPQQIFEHFHGRLRDHKREMFLVVLLDARHRILRQEIVSEGSLTTSIVHPREVFLPAVRESAGAVVLVHNHPSGDPSPSEEDIAVTRRLTHAAELLGIRVLDHVIVGDGCYASFREAGLL